MDVARLVYSRDLKIAVMRAVDSGSTIAEVARKHQLRPKLIERWRGEWRAKGEAAFRGIGRRGAEQAAFSDAARMAELERKIGQLTMENDFLKKAVAHFREYHPPAVVNGEAACLKQSDKPLQKGKAKR